MSHICIHNYKNYMNHELMNQADLFLIAHLQRQRLPHTYVTSVWLLWVDLWLSGLHATAYVSKKTKALQT